VAQPTEVWAAGDAYEPYIGRWSRLVARQLLAWLGVARGAVWLDVGCGTGALAGTVLEAADPAAVVGLDPSAGFVAHARPGSATRGPASWSPTPAACPWPAPPSTPRSAGWSSTSSPTPARPSGRWPG
jgi:Methyltransferase domain